MQKRFVCAAAVLVAALVPFSSPGQESPQPRPPRDAVVDAQSPREVPIERPEQKKTEHDLSDIFSPSKARSPTRRIMVNFWGSTSIKTPSVR